MQVDEVGDTSVIVFKQGKKYGKMNYGNNFHWFIVEVQYGLSLIGPKVALFMLDISVSFKLFSLEVK